MDSFEHRTEERITVMGKIANEIESDWDMTDTVTIPREKYERLLGNKLVYPIGQKLAKKVLDNTGVENMTIVGHTTDVNGFPIYEVKTYGWYDGSHIEQDNGIYLTTEYGLADYKPVTKRLKLVSI